MTSLSCKIPTIGKPEWRSMLRYVAELHTRSLHRACPPFPHPWEDIGPGYCYGPAFGHWDIVHAALDTLPFDAAHARAQLENNLGLQQEDGFIPGSIWMAGKPQWNTDAGHPPVWLVAVQDWSDHHGPDLLQPGYEALRRQIGWFERHRRAEGMGFFYTDILNHSWESGIDEGIRFLDVKTGPLACVDACSHVFSLYRYAQRWGQELGHDVAVFTAKAAALQKFIQERLFDPDTGFFHDIWAVQNPDSRCFAFEGMWPMVVGAATAAQAQRVIEENLLNPRRFFTEHPIPSISVEDPRFELRMWRGPAWNSMSYWAARGCMHYGAFPATRAILERALDASAKQFAATGTIWEFYHPHGGSPTDVQRKPDTRHNTPCPDYLGHNPLLAMALLYDQAKAQQDLVPIPAR